MIVNKLADQPEFIDDSLILSSENINLIIFPDWTQPEELLLLDFERVIKSLVYHPASQQITLLVETGNLRENEVSLLLSGVAMNLLMTENLDVSHGCEISLLGNLDRREWEVLVDYLHCRVTFLHENQAVLLNLPIEYVPACTIDDFSNISLELLILNLGQRLFQQGKWQQAIAQYKRLLSMQLNNLSIYDQLSQCYRNSNLIDEYFHTLKTIVELYPAEARFHFSLIIDLRRYGRFEASIEFSEKACQLFPDDYSFKILKYLAIPTIYNSLEEINFYRCNFAQGLENLIEQTSLVTPQEKSLALAGIGRITNFYLSYQAQNDIDLQRKYGHLVHEIMAVNFPEWVKLLPPSRIEHQRKIRVGYISHYLHAYSGTLWLTGWLKYGDRQDFAIYCYYTGNNPDAVTEQFREYSDTFHHIPYNLPAVCQQIVADQLDILVFPEIGMDPPTMQIAALKLAPIQCTAWGHPVTTGLPTVDYFLSSELMEPENAQSHYSEKLIFLPNIGVAYPQPYIPPLCKTRGDFQLPEDAIIYLCCQAPCKYLPQYDFILPEIARLVPQAKFLFLRGELFQQRLERAFSSVGLNSEDYCLFLSIPERFDYLMINLLSDVYLDTFDWSGGNTSLEAIACNLPLVTCPGEFMRGRHSYSFLKMLGLTDTIAYNPTEYIAIAVKLGLDASWRNHISAQMHQKQHLLFDDRTCVRGLEAFYRQVVKLGDQN